MKAAVCYEFGKPLVIEDLEMRAPRPDEVLVKVAYTAICHSDLHDMNGDFEGGLPFVGGHETAGRVAETGCAVSAFAAGDPVVVSLLEHCGECVYCATGRSHLCVTKTTFDTDDALLDPRGRKVINKARVGGFAEYVLVHQSQLVKLPESFPLDLACMLACGVTTGFGAVVNRAKVPPFSSVAVIGAGGVGVNAIQGARVSGADPVIAVDIRDSKLERARQFGATHTVNSVGTDPVAAVQAITGGRGVEYAIVAVGDSQALQQAWGMLCRDGKAVMVGLPPFEQPLFSISGFELAFSEKTVTGCCMGTTRPQLDVPALISLYQEGRYDLDSLVSGRYPLSRINEAIASTAAGEVYRNLIVVE